MLFCVLFSICKAMKRRFKSSYFAHGAAKILRLNKVQELPGVPAGRWRSIYFPLKKIPLLLFVLLFIVQRVDAKLYSATQDIKVRKGAGTKYPSIGTLKKGENIVVDETRGDWGKVTFEEKDGYVPLNSMTDVVDDTPPPPVEQPDTDDELGTKTLVQIGVVILVLLALQQYHNFRSRQQSKAGYPADDKPKHKPVYWFYCISCRQKVNADKQPTNHYCPKAEDHTWINLGEAGKQNYHCRHCGVTVRTKKAPTTKECPGGTVHTWTDLGEFGDKNYYCKNCGVSVLVAKSPTTDNCAKADAHSWKLL
jgi:SH3 domain-containing protein